jgi:hypothetical protein
MLVCKVYQDLHGRVHYTLASITHQKVTYVKTLSDMPKSGEISWTQFLSDLTFANTINVYTLQKSETFINSRASIFEKQDLWMKMLSINKVNQFFEG